ncbi:iron-siderophore ABC transporter substrate-binding protein [Paenibacillus sp. S3N08]|uniref:Iron-siderophore ABC transporter substrate-binding protein n=2 Tax=Paenibacillus agricola TaxID=2716264 RepID=A0ABX0J7V0_9BACL|nr:iron-siderophore ABC transporter substrate-binding protein [Paenibacillus agricola]
MRTLFKPVTTLLCSALLLFTAACGASPQTPAPAGGASAPTTVQPAATSASTTKTIKHAMGTAEIKGTPKQIVVLEWSFVEDLLALGIQPAGVADIKGYKRNVNIKPQLAENMVDVGTRQESNLEAIAGLKPDLIITAASRAKQNYEQLKQIAPTIVFDAYPLEGAGDQYSVMEATFKTIADLVGKNSEADKILNDLEKVYADSKEKLKAAKKDGAEFALTQASSNQNAASLRMFHDNSMIVQILQRAGLKNAFKSPKFESLGFTTGSVELLPSVQNANFIYIVQPEDNVFEKQLKDNAVWKGLSFVKENRIYALPGTTWTFGGPLSAQVIVELTTQALTK